MKTINFYGEINDFSGYGNASRALAIAFSKSDVSLKICSDITNSNKAFVSSLKITDDVGGIDFYVGEPPWNKVKNNNYKIAYFNWKTDKLPNAWKNALSSVNEIWVPTLYQKDLVVSSGFRGEVCVIPTPSLPRNFSRKTLLSTKRDKDILADEIFNFYAIMNWHEREGWKELLSAYYKSFKPEEKVCLVLKANPLPGNTAQSIVKDINSLKYHSGLKYFPKVFLITDRLNEDYVSALHASCMVIDSPHRGKGWGMSIHDALLANNLVISTKFGGISDWLDDSNSKIVKHIMGPVSNMSWNPLYNTSQNWANPSILSLASQMRDCYDNFMTYEEVVLAGHDLAMNFTTDAVSQYINSRLESL